VLWGASAAEVHGIQGLPADDRVWVLLPIAQECPQSTTVRLRFREPCPAEVCVVGGFPVTTLCRTLADSCGALDRWCGLGMLDSALHLELLSPEQLVDVALLAVGRRGAVQLRELLGIADGRAASPLESRVRLHACDAGVPPDELQWPVRDRHGVVVGYTDMAWLRPGRRPLIAEADGEGAHGIPRAITHDRHRQNDFVGADADILRFTWADSMRRGYIATTLRRSLYA
jgi:hypothetical protein